MKIKWGHTRIAFVYDKVTVKVPRVRFILMARALIAHGRGKRSRHAGRRRWEDSLFGIILIYLFSGLGANRREAGYSRTRTPSVGYPVMPVYWLSPLSLIEIQQTGQELSQDEWKRLIAAMRSCGVPLDHIHRDDFSSWHGAVFVHDCGSRRTLPMLERAGFRALAKANRQITVQSEKGFALKLETA